MTEPLDQTEMAKTVATLRELADKVETQGSADRALLLGLTQLVAAQAASFGQLLDAIEQLEVRVARLEATTDR